MYELPTVRSERVGAGLKLLGQFENCHKRRKTMAKSLAKCES